MQPLNISYQKIIKRVIVFSIVVLFFYIIIFKLTPFFLAFLMVLVMEKPVSFLSRYMPRLPSVIIVLTIILIILTLAAFIVSSNIISELIALGKVLPQYREQITDAFDGLIQRQEEVFEVIPDEISSLLRQNINVIYQRGDQVLSQIVNRAVNFTFNIPGILIFIIFTVFSSFYISRDKAEIFNYISGRFNLTDQDKMKLVNDFSTYVRVQLFIITNTTIWVGVILTLIEFPYAILLAIAAGILDLIPIIGPGVIILPLIVYHVYLNPLYAVILFIVYIIVIGFRPFLEANILGTNIGVHPVILLLGLYAGLNLMGFQGVILAPLTIITFKGLLVADIGL
ncbi:MAG: AI-2E family transporter [Halarsenatibacteraceae bacterium]